MSDSKRTRLPEDIEALCPGKLFTPPENLTVACYLFPGFHKSAFNDIFFSPGWTEYILMRSCHPWFPGHNQPRQPLLGELDEGLPSTWEIYNRLAAENGVDVFIWDSYWYENGPVFHEALDSGFLRSSNCEKVKFAVMWTNHTWPVWSPDVGTDDNGYINYMVDPQDDNREDIWRSMTYMISRYTQLPNYWRIDNKPVFVIWDACRLKSKLGVDGCNTLFDELREFAKKLGHAGLHIHAALPNYKDFEGLIFDSYGDYNPLQMTAYKMNPNAMVHDFSEVAATVVANRWSKTSENTVFYPCVSPGWDTCPRRIPHASEWKAPEGVFSPVSTVIINNEKPSAFKGFIQAAFDYLNRKKLPNPILTIACWNEWTEGHYLLPDTKLGYGMLSALREARGLPDVRKIITKRYIGSLRSEGNGGHTTDGNNISLDRSF